MRRCRAAARPSSAAPCRSTALDRCGRHRLGPDAEPVGGGSRAVDQGPGRSPACRRRPHRPARARLSDVVAARRGGIIPPCGCASPRCRARATTSSCSTRRARRSRSTPRSCAASPTGASASAPTRSWSSSRAPTPGVDFRYRIFNGGSGDEVEHCGNGARCFVRFVRERGLTDKTTLARRDHEPPPRAAPAGRRPRHGRHGRARLRPGARAVRHHLARAARRRRRPAALAGRARRRPQRRRRACVSMGNPHAVQIVADVDAAPVAQRRAR